MAQRTPGSIVNEGLMSLVDLHYNQKKAQLEAERASTQKSVEGRQILPGVMAQLAELRAKEQAQKEKISRQGESQGPSPQSMMPPMVEVSGQTSGRSPTQALKSASEIAQFVSGGAGIKQGMIGGVFGQQAPQQAPMQQLPPGGPVSGAPGGAPLSPAPPAQAGAQAPAPGAGPDVPGSQVAVTGPASRAKGALELVLGMATRSGQMMLEGGMKLATGEQQIGVRQVPTEEQIGIAYGNDLAELEMLRQNTSNPQAQAAAETVYKQRLEEIRSRYGNGGVDAATREMTTYVLEKNRVKRDKLEAEERALTKSKDLSGYRADLNANNQRDLAAFNSGLRTAEGIAKEQRERITPTGQLKEKQDQIELKYLESGEKALTEPELSALPAVTQRKIALRQAPSISPSTRAELEGFVNTAREYQQMARQLKEHWNPGYFSTGAGAWAEVYKQRSRAAGAGITAASLDDKESQWYADYQGMDTPVRHMKADVVRSKAGAAATPLELELYLPIIPGPNDSKESAGVKLDQFIEYQGMTALRSALALRSGYNIESAKKSWPFADMRKMVAAFEESAVLKLQDENPGMDPDEALRQVDQLIMDEYGLDAQKYAVP